MIFHEMKREEKWNGKTSSPLIPTEYPPIEISKSVDKAKEFDRGKELPRRLSLNCYAAIILYIYSVSSLLGILVYVDVVPERWLNRGTQVVSRG